MIIMNEFLDILFSIVCQTSLFYHEIFFKDFIYYENKTAQLNYCYIVLIIHFDVELPEHLGGFNYPNCKPLQERGSFLTFRKNGC